MHPLVQAIVPVVSALIPELVRAIRGAGGTAEAEAHARRLLIDAAYESARRYEEARRERR